MAVNAAQFPIGNDKTLDPKLTHYCAPKHWDPTMIFRYSVPGGMNTNSLSLPMDPRPWAKICLQYVNSDLHNLPPQFLPVLSSLVLVSSIPLVVIRKPSTMNRSCAA